ncbi:MAG: hypothetical protein HKN57_06755 [Xanthomonadales bacterium]|nr:hypothetical protein [Gammaproteobacteria bacterium]NND56932.1 hypothetical protein [Xanthomonadales bacterium]NNK52529.1 hypothetical protein [Xanthomonadales bacterium]
MKGVARTILGVCSVLLVGTAYYHSTGLAGLEEAISDTSLPTFLAKGIPILWLFFSWHLIVVSVPLLWLAVRLPNWSVPVALFCGVVVLGDFMWVFSVAGWFPGTIVLAAVAAGILMASIMLKGDANADTT